MASTSYSRSPVRTPREVICAIGTDRASMSVTLSRLKFS
jgi:hypothetical protein